MIYKRQYDSGARPVGEVISESTSAFGRLLKRARELERLNLRVLPLLDPKIAEHCRLANVSEGRMVFVCSSSACATRLRLQAPDLIKRMHELGLVDINVIKVMMMHDHSGAD